MSPFNRLARLVLMVHSLAMIAQGIYSFVEPAEYAALAGDIYAGAPNKALQSMGMGSIAIGWYQLIFAYQGNRRLMASTIPLRLGFAAMMTQWDNTGLVAYEVAIAWICLIAVFL